MKSVCLVSYIAPYTIPYIDVYLKIFKQNGVQCDVVYWDREGKINQQEEEYINYYSYRAIISNMTRLKKYVHYIPATMFFRSMLKKKDYDGIVFLQTHAAVACSSILHNKYKGRYIVDIRDYTLENIYIYRELEKKIIKNSFFTVISSPGYKEFLPKHDYVVAHNYTEQTEKIIKSIKDSRKINNPINISFIGYVRFYEVAKKLLLLFKNDERYWLNFIGTGAEALREFCVDNNIENVKLEGTFDPKQTADYYRECNLINNVYGNNNNFLDFALSNKLYYAAQFNIPILVSKNTFSSEISRKYGFGIEINPDDPKEVDRLYDKLIELNKDEMKKGADKFLEIVKRDNRVFENRIRYFIK